MTSLTIIVAIELIIFGLLTALEIVILLAGLKVIVRDLIHSYFAEKQAYMRAMLETGSEGPETPGFKRKFN